MNETPDSAAFQRVWRRVMPEDRADCPFVLSGPASPARLPSGTPQPPAPAVRACLGEGCRSALPELARLLVQTHDAARIYRTLARRGGRTGRLLACIAAEKERQVRRLSAARFLILGETFSFPPTRFPRMGSPALALRERYQAEQQAAQDFLHAALQTADPCLIQLYRDLAAQDQAHAGQLRERLEGE